MREIHRDGAGAGMAEKAWNPGAGAGSVRIALQHRADAGRSDRNAERGRRAGVAHGAVGAGSFIEPIMERRERTPRPGMRVQMTHRTAYNLPAGLKQGDIATVVAIEAGSMLATVEKDGQRYEVLWFLCDAGSERWVNGEWREEPMKPLPAVEWKANRLGDG